MTKVNIYYGGRGLIEDPTIYVMDKITEVLNELNVVVRRYNLYEDKKRHLRFTENAQRSGCRYSSCLCRMV